MPQFEFTAKNGATLIADYVIEDGQLSVTYRESTMTVAAGLNEIGNAFLRDNLMRSMLGELDGISAAAADSPGAAPQQRDGGPSFTMA